MVESYPLPTGIAAVDAPVQKIVEAGGFYFRSILLLKAGYIVPQHTHDHSHVTFIGSGKVRGWAAGVWIGDKEAGDCFDIQAGVEHVFQALEPYTLLTCVHNIDSALRLMRKGV